MKKKLLIGGVAFILVVIGVFAGLIISENHMVNQKRLERARKYLESTELELANIKIALQVEKDKIEDIKRPKFLRTPYEKEQQLTKQYELISMYEKKVLELETYQAQLKSQIAQLE